MIETSRGLAAGAELAARVIQSVPEVDALFCAGDVLAAGALFECQKRGWAVPGRIALASFDDVDLLRHVSPAVTTLRLLLASALRKCCLVGLWMGPSTYAAASST